jgi:hypothetical protein
MPTNYIDNVGDTDFFDHSTPPKTLFLDRSLPEGKYLGLGGPGGEVSGPIIPEEPLPPADVRPVPAALILQARLHL